MHSRPKGNLMNRWFVPACFYCVVLLTVGTTHAGPGSNDPHVWRQANQQVGHIRPALTIKAPGAGSNSEAGVGALIPWADRLWAIGYVAHKQGEGLGLVEIKSDFSYRLHPKSVTGTYANRHMHWPSNQAFIGPYAIDETGNVRLIEELVDYRLTATAPHLTDPMKVYCLGMEGTLFEVNAKTLAVKKLFDLNDELNFPRGADDHYKGMHASQGQLVVANNTYDEAEHQGKRTAGRLASWNGKDDWRIIEKNPFVEVAGISGKTGRSTNAPIYALGWDAASPILRVLIDGQWHKYRLPRGGHEWSHAWYTEWMRIRQAQTERFLMDAFGIYYRLPRQTYNDAVWGIKPISSHQRIVPDFCYWQGLLVLGGDQTDHDVGQPQSGLWFGSVDDLHRLGKPTGWGAVWRKAAVEAGAVSDPMLMTGFDKIGLHLIHNQNKPVTFTLEVDPLGDGTWQTYRRVEVDGSGYSHVALPQAFSAHWMRVRVDRDCTATAQFFFK
jgi:hypothetical protein